MKANRFKCYFDMYYPSELPSILERETEEEMKKYKKRLIEHVRKEIEYHEGKNVDVNSICKYIEEFDQPKRVITKEDPYGEEIWDDDKKIDDGIYRPNLNDTKKGYKATIRI